MTVKTIPYQAQTLAIVGDAAAAQEIADIINIWQAGQMSQYLKMHTIAPAVFSHAGKVDRAKCPRCRGEIVFEIAYKDGFRSYVCDLCFYHASLGAFKARYREAERVTKTTTKLLERVKR